MPEVRIPFPEFHTEVTTVSKSLYESGHFTDALRKTCIKLEEECRKIYKEKTGVDKTGVPLFQQLFRYREEEEITKIQERNSRKSDEEDIEDESECLLPLVNLSTTDGVIKQKAFCNLYASIGEILRNTLAHSSEDMEDIEALYWLNIASYLFYKLDRARKLNEIISFVPPQVLGQLTETEEESIWIDVEMAIANFLIDDRIQQVPTQTQDRSLAKLSIEKILEIILVERIEELWDAWYNALSNDPLKQEIINTLITKLYDSNN